MKICLPVTSAMQRWMIYNIWWVTAKVNTELSGNFNFRNFIKNKNTYQSIHLKFLMTATFIFRVENLF